MNSHTLDHENVTSKEVLPHSTGLRTEVISAQPGQNEPVNHTELEKEIQAFEDLALADFEDGQTNPKMNIEKIEELSIVGSEDSLVIILKVNSSLTLLFVSKAKKLKT